MADLEKKYLEIDEKISAMSQQCVALSEQIKSDIDNRQKDTAAAKSAVEEAVKVLGDCKKMRDEADDILLRIQQKEKGIVQTTAADETEAYVKTMYNEIKAKEVRLAVEEAEKNKGNEENGDNPEEGDTPGKEE